MPVGLGNNTTEYDTSILLNQGNNGAGPSNAGDNQPDASGSKAITEDQESKDDLYSVDNNAIDPSSLDAKATDSGKKVVVKKESVVPMKQRSQVDRIADAEVARFECKKVKFEVERRRLETVENVNLAKAQEKTRRVVGVRQAELDVTREKMRMDHEYRMEMLKHGQLPPSPYDAHPLSSLNGSQPNPAAWNQSPPTFQPYTTPQPLVPFKVPSPERSNSPNADSELFSETGY